MEAVNCSDSSKLENNLLTKSVTSLAESPTIVSQQEKVLIKNEDLGVEYVQNVNDNKASLPLEGQKHSILKHSIVIPGLKKYTLSQLLTLVNVLLFFVNSHFRYLNIETSNITLQSLLLLNIEKYYIKTCLILF